MCAFPLWWPLLASLPCVSHFLLTPFSWPALGTCFPTALGIMATFVAGFVCPYLQDFPLGLSAAVSSAGWSSRSGAGSDVTCASAELLQGAVRCPHQPRRSLQPWGSPMGTGHIVEGQDHLRSHLIHPLHGSNSCDGASLTGLPLQPCSGFAE